MGCKLSLDIKGGENTRTVVPTERIRKRSCSTSPMSDMSTSDMSTSDMSTSDMSTSDMSTSPIFMLSDGSSLYELSSSSGSETAPDDSSKEGSGEDAPDN